jgi:hypothetical protein
LASPISHSAEAAVIPPTAMKAQRIAVRVTISLSDLDFEIIVISDAGRRSTPPK